jgi:hypothetical protein
MNNKLGLGLFSVAAAAAMLVGCGGGHDAPAQAASSNLTAPVTSASVAAVAGQGFTFQNGVTNFGTASPTTVTLNSASSFSVASAEGTASGNLAFGSCIFTVTASTFPVGSRLALGQVVTVHPCSITVATAGVNPLQNAVARAVSFLLENNASLARNLSVDVSDNGTVTVSGVAIGSVTLTFVTGGS